MAVNIYKFKEQFDKEYAFLYEHGDNVAGARQAASAFDDFAKDHGEFVGEFARFRGDYITSDREAAAFMFALLELAQ